MHLHKRHKNTYINAKVIRLQKIQLYREKTNFQKRNASVYSLKRRAAAAAEYQHSGTRRGSVPSRSTSKAIQNLTPDPMDNNSSDVSLENVSVCRTITARTSDVPVLKVTLTKQETSDFSSLHSECTTRKRKHVGKKGSTNSSQFWPTECKFKKEVREGRNKLLSLWKLR